MYAREITIILEDLLDALSEPNAEAHLNRRTGEIAVLFAGDQWKEDDIAADARQDMAARPADWLRMPSVDLDADDGQKAFAEWLTDQCLLAALA